MFFITTIYVNDFCETVLVKKKHTLPRYDLNFPFQYAVFLILHWLFDGTYTAQTHLWALKRQKRNVEGAALELPLGLTRPEPCEPVFHKNNLPASSFGLYILPRKCTLLTLAVHSLLWVHVNTHFDMLLNNVTCMLVVLFFLCVRKHESKVPTNILTRMGK